MKRTVFFILIFAGMLCARVSLDQAVNQGIRKNLKIRNRGLAANAKKQKIELRKKIKLPQFNIAGNYMFQSQQMELKLEPVHLGPGQVFPGLSRTIGSKHVWDLQMSVIQPIYTGNVLNLKLRQAVNEKKSAEVSIKMEQVRLAARIRQTYYFYRLYRQKQESLRKLIEKMLLHQKKLQTLFNESMAGKTDLLDVRSKILEARINYEKLNGPLAEYRADFIYLSGYQPEDVVPGADHGFAQKKDAWQYFLKHHPQLDLFARRSSWLKMEQGITAGKYRPRISGFAELHWGKPGVDYFSNEWSLYLRSGLNFSWPVFNWNRKSNELGIVKSAQAQLKNEQKDFVLQVEKTLNKLYQQRASLLRRLAQAISIKEIAADNRSLKEQLFLEKEISNIDLLAALKDEEKCITRIREIRISIMLTDTAIHGAVGFSREEK